MGQRCIATYLTVFCIAFEIEDESPSDCVETFGIANDCDKMHEICYLVEKRRVKVVN